MLFSAISFAAALLISPAVVFGKDLPSTPTKYVTTIEANIGNKEKTYVLEEWYDEDRSRARRTFHYSNYIFTFLEDYSSDSDELWMYLQSADDLDNVIFCTLESYSNKSATYHNRLQVFGQWLQDDGSMQDSIYEGQVGDLDDNGEECDDYNMRGLRANKWTKYNLNSSTTYDNGATSDVTYNASYYWSLGNWSYSTYSGQNTEIPLRIEVTGNHITTYTNGSTNTYDFYHSYEYVSFFEGDSAFDSDEILDFYLNMPDWVDECTTDHYCSYYPSAEVCSDSKGPTIPDLPDTFSAMFEVNDKKQNTTMIAKEYYDYPNDRAHVVYIFGPNYKTTDSWHELALGSVSQRWFWIGDGSASDERTYCTMDLIDNDYSGLDLFIEEIEGHVARPSKWFHFDSNKTWLGYTSVRNGIWAERWKSTWVEEYGWNGMYWIKINATSYFYFSTSEWSVPFANWSVVPVRIEYEGMYEVYNGTQSDNVYWMSGEFDVSDDIIDFQTLYIDNGHFDRPDDWRDDCVISEEYCGDVRFKDTEDVCSEGPDLPVLPDSFETTVECVFVSKNFSMVVDEYYDYEGNRARIITYPYRYVSSLFGFETVVQESSHMLEDGDLFWTWKQSNGGSVDSGDGSESSVVDCELSLISQASGNGISTFFDTEKNHISGTKTLFGWVANATVESYVGTETVRGIECDQWKHKLQTWTTTFEAYGVTYTYVTNLTVVYSFMTEEFKSSEIYGDWGVPVRADVYGHTAVSSGYGFSSEYDFEHYYNYVRFLPITPDDEWFEPPDDEIMCNITKYCSQVDSFNGVESNSVDGASSEEYEDLCDEMSNGGIVTLESSDSASASESEDQVTDNDSSSEEGKNSNGNGNADDTVGIWIFAIVLAIICFVGGVFYGNYRAKQENANMVRLQDDPNNPNL